MYTGFFMPNGQVPPSNILFNGDRAQDFETIIDNQATTTMFLWRLMNLAISVFKWENLPDGVDERMLEWWLFRDGFTGFFKDDTLKNDPKARAPEGYAVLPMLIMGEFDNYEYPMNRNAYSINGMNIPLTEDNSVIIFNNFLRVPMWFTVIQYAKRLADVQRSIDINIRQQRTARAIICEEKERLTYLNAAAQIDEGKPWIMGSKIVDPDNFISIDTSTPYVADDLQVYKSKIWNEALTFLGIENTNTDKKERMVSDEVITNMGDVESERFTRLNARQQAANEINDKFGLNIKVDFRSGAYIRTANTGNSRVTVEDGMIQTNVDGDSYE